jgi:hypothetical protein
VVANSTGRTGEPATGAPFIARISRNQCGIVNAILERVRTGETVRLNEFITIGEVITRW